MAKEGHPLQPPLGKLIKPSISTVLPLSDAKDTQGPATLPKPGVNNGMNLAEKQPEPPAALHLRLGSQPPQWEGMEPSGPWGSCIFYHSQKEKN